MGATTEPEPPRRAHEEGLHRLFVRKARTGTIRLLFIGDSHTQRWRRQRYGRPLWRHYFRHLKPANFGIGGANTQRLLWRVRDGELDGYRAELVVLMLGTNNLRDSLPLDACAGVGAVLDEIALRQPDAHVIVLAIPPRGDVATHRLRLRGEELNARLAALATSRGVEFLMWGQDLIDADGRLGKWASEDGIHLTTAGYAVLAEAIAPRIHDLMGKSPKLLCRARRRTARFRRVAAG